MKSKTTSEKVADLLARRANIDKQLAELQRELKKETNPSLSAYNRSTPIELATQIPARIINVLDNIGIKTLGDLENYSLKQLRKHRNLGEKSLAVFIELEQLKVIRFKTSR